MKSKNSKVLSTIFCVIIFLVVVGVSVYFIFFKDKGYTPLSEIDLGTYEFIGVDTADRYILNDPNDPSGALIFENKTDSDDTLKAKLAEAEIENFSTKEIGEFEMDVTVGDKTLKVKYTVGFKDVSYPDQTISLSVHNPIELNGIYAYCYDYNDRIYQVSLYEIFGTKDEFDVSDVTSFTQTASTTYNGEFISVDYHVGYIGYGNNYNSQKVENGTTYRLRNFTMNMTDTDSGTGSFTLSYKNSLYDFDETLQYFTLTWEKEILNDYISLNITDLLTEKTYHGIYYYPTSANSPLVVSLDANILNTLTPIEFTLGAI